MHGYKTAPFPIGRDGWFLSLSWACVTSVGAGKKRKKNFPFLLVDMLRSWQLCSMLHVPPNSFTSENVGDSRKQLTCTEFYHARTGIAGKKRTLMEI